MTLWAPVVYGRTPTSDTWWRAIPAGLDQHGWLGIVVHSVLAAGSELKRRPRFLLAQDPTHRIVGVACQAGDLSDTMRSVGSRELFCFVGWVASRTGPSEPEAPDFEELERGYREWAAPVYARMLAGPWDASATAYSEPVMTQPEQAVWNPPARRPKPGLPPATGPWAEQAWPLVWAAALAAREPLTCVIGWQRMSSARFEDATHIGVADAPMRPPPRVDYAEPGARPGPLKSKPLKPADPKPTEEVLALKAPSLSAIADNPAAGAPEKPAPTRPGATPTGRRSLLDRLPARIKLAVAAAVGAAVVGLAVAIISPGPAPAPTGPPLLLQVVIPVSDHQTAASIVQYRGGVLLPGQSTARMALWSGSPAAGSAACASRVAAAPIAAPVQARPGLQMCVELKGVPSRYALLEIAAVTKAAVTATATLWP
jgi:hypothetical protein